MRGPSLVSATLDWRVAAFAALAGAATMLFGAAPALWSLRTSLSTALVGGRGPLGVSRSQSYAKNALIAAQLALSLVLLTSTALLLRTLSELHTVELGMEPGNVPQFSVNPRAAGMPTNGQPAMRQAMLAAVERTPGVAAAAFAAGAPLSGDFRSSTIEVEGYEPGENEDMNIVRDVATSGYFRAFGIPLMSGRLLTDDDARTIVVL